MSRWIDVLAEGRALALGQLGIGPRSMLLPTEENRRRPVFEVLLGLRGVSPQLEADEAARLAPTVRALNFRVAAQLQLVHADDGWVIASPVTLRAKAGSQPGRQHMDGRLLASLATRKLTGSALNAVIAAGTVPLRNALSRELQLTEGDPVVYRLRLGAQAPILLLSTAGDPTEVHRALDAYLSVISSYGHGDLRIVVADDARRIESVTQLTHVIAKAQEQFGVDISRFSEVEDVDASGLKRRFRNKLHRALVTDGADPGTTMRVFAPGLTGTANSLFVRYVGADTIWLEQDARPFAAERLEPHSSTEELALAGNEFGFNLATDLPITDPDFVSARPDLVFHPVDFPHIIDRVLHATDLETVSVSCQTETYEDVGFGAVSIEPRWPSRQAQMAHFHTCGHADFRARLGHIHVINGQLSSSSRTTFLDGGLPFYRVYQDAPPSMHLKRWNSAFGTVVAFSGDQPIQPPTMWSTSIRLFDFSVGEFLQQAGATGGIAGSVLSHHRCAVTASGRGWFADYVMNEDLLWPLMCAARTAFANVTTPARQDPEAWLNNAAESLVEHASQYPLLAPSLTHALWSEFQSDIRRSVRSGVDATRSYGESLDEALRPFGSWVAYHRHLESVVGGELRRYAHQLRLWSQVHRLYEQEHLNELIRIQ